MISGSKAGMVLLEDEVKILRVCNVKILIDGLSSDMNYWIFCLTYNPFTLRPRKDAYSIVKLPRRPHAFSSIIETVNS